MSIQNLISSFSSSATNNSAENNETSPLDTIGSMIPRGLAGGAAAGGIMALLMGSKSTRKIASKVAKVGGTAVLGGMAYKAYDNWQKNKSLNQTDALTNQDISNIQSNLPHLVHEQNPLHIRLVMAMIAASKADGEIDANEQKRLFDAIAKMEMNAEEKAALLDMMARDINLDELTANIDSDEHKSEIYLAAYLAIEVDHQSERSFLNNLATQLQLPKGFPAYLEQQADQGLAND